MIECLRLFVGPDHALSSDLEIGVDAINQHVDTFLAQYEPCSGSILAGDRTTVASRWTSYASWQGKLD